ncbi:hypothetical protein F5Y07DRAFT_107098 [Xylaria sp. FL0933]|nr:hypothetical protein F5Y07DRAFT_107098 [Xylaria sp. FL0933]
MPPDQIPSSSRTPSTSRPPTSGSLDTRKVDLCRTTARRILRNGFEVNHLDAYHSVQIGTEPDTGVVLVVSAGRWPIRDVKHTHAGISEGLTDMAEDGSEFALFVKFPISLCYGWGTDSVSAW